MTVPGVNVIVAATFMAAVGDIRRFPDRRKLTAYLGLDPRVRQSGWPAPGIGVHRSDRRARVGKLTRQGSPQLRWALYEAALSACRPSSPDHADYLALKARGLSHTRASLTIARKLARRSFHVLRELGPDALEPVAAA